MTPSLWKPLVFVALATLFEGYDAVITGMAFPSGGKDFNIGPKELGFAMNRITIGAIAAFVPIQLADQYGLSPFSQRWTCARVGANCRKGDL